MGLFPLSASADMASSEGPLVVREVISGLQAPWGFAFLDGGGVLVSERWGRLSHLDADGTMRVVAGLPEVYDRGQGGLLDVMVPRDFATTREVFLTFAKPQGRGAGTTLARAVLSENGRSLQDLRILWELTPGSSGGRHFGSRVLEGADGHLYVTIGDRGDRPSAQDLSNENGTVIRLTRNGLIPEDNPFLGRADVLPQIFSYGHRNAQGLAMDTEGRIWTAEHGARGGDEINLVLPGRNYGWPVISYGRHYSGFQIGEGTQKPGMEQPALYWDPSMAPSGMMIYAGDMFAEWGGDIFVGSLKFDYIARIDNEASVWREVEQLRSDETLRVRDIRQAPDGSIWFLSVGNGALYRISREEG